MPSVNAVISSATNDCADAAVPRAAGNRSSMRNVSTGNANCAPIAATNNSACCTGIGSASSEQMQEHAHQRDAANVMHEADAHLRRMVHAAGDAVAR